MSIQQSSFFYAGLEVIPSQNKICFDGQEVSMEPIAMKLLESLCEARGATVDKALLRKQVWNDVVVCRHAIYRVVGKVRCALQKVGCHIELETISRVGYRLVCRADVSTSVSSLKESSWVNIAQFVMEAGKEQSSEREQKPEVETKNESLVMWYQSVKCGRQYRYS